MKRLFLIIMLVSLVALAACSQPETPQPTAEVIAEPTEAPATAEATAEPTAEPAPPTAEPTPAITVDPALIDTLWLWTRRDAAEPLDVTDPEKYNLLFNEDGTFFAGLDCNRGSGTYFTPGDGTIAMELGAITRALCPEDSLEGQMVDMFANAASYEIVEDSILLITAADGSTDTFVAADTFIAGPATMENADPDLIDRVWQWESRVANSETTLVPTPEDYALTFNDDGSFFAVLDCNVGGGSYTSDGPGSIVMTLERTTLAFCLDDSLSEPMKSLFGQAITYTFEENGDVLVMTHEDGTVDTFRAATDKAPTLTGAPWQWLGTTTGEGPVYVADSTRYLVEFMDDGSAVITADCNNIIAEFTTDESALTITPGAATLVACEGDSQGELFAQQLANAAAYTFREGHLYIELADGGTMRLSRMPDIDLPEPEAGEPTGTVNAPDGVFLRTGPGTNFPSVGAAAQGDSGTLIGISEDGQWLVVNAPSLPDGRVWVFAQFVDATGAENLPVVPTPPLPDTLVGRTWLWLGTTTPTQQIGVNDPNRYAIDFLDDGTAAIQADCNRVVATYTTDGQSITITPGAATLVACEEGSQGDLFVQQLSNAAIFFFQAGELFIDQAASAGTMRFVSNAAVSGPAPEGSGPTDLPFRVVSFGPVGAETPVIEGTEISVEFDPAAGQISGFSGCNTYTGSLNTQDGAFGVGPLASTVMACAEPAGVMEQEAAFLAALAGATSFQWATAPNTFITNGTINYTLADGTDGVMTLVSP